MSRPRGRKQRPTRARPRAVGTDTAAANPDPLNFTQSFNAAQVLITAIRGDTDRAAVTALISAVYADRMRGGPGVFGCAPCLLSGHAFPASHAVLGDIVIELVTAVALVLTRIQDTTGQAIEEIVRDVRADDSTPSGASFRNAVEDV